MNGNSYVVKNGSGYVILEMEYSEANKYTMSLDYNRDCARVEKSVYGYYYYENQTVAIKVLPKVGYVVNEVKFDGEVITANENGEYVIVITSGENKFSVTFDKVTTNMPTYNPDDPVVVAPGTSGCGSVLAGGIFSIISAFGVTMYALKKKKD